MSEVNKLNDEDLQSVSGGAGKTTMGFTYDNKGTVNFNGLKISAADWKWLLSQYPGTPRDQEAALASVPVHDVEAMLNDHNSPFK